MMDFSQAFSRHFEIRHYFEKKEKERKKEKLGHYNM